ncbi:hypothetical protein [Deinococcus radiotolerans]|uniref:Lipoprotein n=1 Tax=Deinococcus radiotolerans TaxID=1309407 RepID=A0ABQ2FM18_9DEIO|nr:hypothetical protein [Deinococcus radiotolerans]GGL02204.1 hypothetical protein GCM10010844_20920 [Deinococcus radiotolerans]
MTKTLRLLLPLTTAALLASCATTAAPSPDSPRLTAQDGKYNIDICPSCGRPGLGAWVAPAPQAALSIIRDGEETLDKVDASAIRAAFVTEPSADLTHLVLAGSSDLSLPVACLLPMQLERPQAVPALMWPSESTVLNVWTGGLMRRAGTLTLAELSSVQKGDQLCSATFGEGWRMLSVTDSMDTLNPGTGVDDLWAYSK